MWRKQDRPNWTALLTPTLIHDLEAGGDFFNNYADEETGLYGSEERRRWFDLGGFHVQREFQEQIGHLYDVKLELWF